MYLLRMLEAWHAKQGRVPCVFQHTLSLLGGGGGGERVLVIMHSNHSSNDQHWKSKQASRTAEKRSSLREQCVCVGGCERVGAATATPSTVCGCGGMSCVGWVEAAATLLPEEACTTLPQCCCCQTHVLLLLLLLCVVLAAGSVLCV